MQYCPTRTQSYVRLLSSKWNQQKEEAKNLKNQLSSTLQCSMELFQEKGASGWLILCYQLLNMGLPCISLPLRMLSLSGTAATKSTITLYLCLMRVWDITVSWLLPWSDNWATSPAAHRRSHKCPPLSHKCPTHYTIDAPINMRAIVHLQLFRKWHYVPRAGARRCVYFNPQRAGMHTRVLLCSQKSGRGLGAMPNTRKC